ncbi:hypothetical membrane protein [Taylorella equigenitalis 14/56]|uniref:Membrane protein n=2 Tax=Taylorella equigenitalis TaxID=29575 RepID=A0ABN4AV14_9BURK|nr:hypothetical protein [Taylorella equigenitalis]AFN35698.1 putative membrane protein [Taylorella equigenitalis ATCC 35865]ASY39118.1 hypothetical protein CA604_03060 [Taylorella equigenitalis]WDU52404.1 hypothetical protein KNO32_02900 [Taylorella equigenitalis]WDU55405.1 hypothetical protein KPZ19_03045 [Taylorella equigenitalis]CCG17795.1 hypothetical membrane protein [Taylorella equigenitalis 14/56]
MNDQTNPPKNNQPSQNNVNANILNQNVSNKTNAKFIPNQQHPNQAPKQNNTLNNQNLGTNNPQPPKKKNSILLMIVAFLVAFAVVYFFGFAKKDKQTTQEQKQTTTTVQPKGDNTTTTTTTTDQKVEPKEEKGGLGSLFGGSSSDETYKNIQEFVAKNYKEGELTWESKTNLEGSGVRLNNVVFKSPGEAKPFKFENIDVLEFKPIEGGYNYEIKGKNVTIDGKHPFMFDDESQKQLAAAGITSLEPLEFYQKVERDISADEAVAKGDIVQPGLFTIKSSGKVGNINSFYKALAEDPTVAEDTNRMIALLTPMSVHDLDIEFEDKGLIKAVGVPVQGFDINTCVQSLAMFKVNLDSNQLCEPISNLLSGKSQDLKIKIKPSSPYQVSKLMSVFASPNPDFKAIFNEMGLSITN